MFHSGVCVVSSARLEWRLLLRLNEGLGVVNASLLKVARRRGSEVVLMFIVLLFDYSTL